MERIIDLLGYLEPPFFHDLRYEYCDILWVLKVKKQKLDLREAYSKIISAENDGDRHSARIAYLNQRTHLGDVDVPEFPF